MIWPLLLFLGTQMQIGNYVFAVHRVPKLNSPFWKLRFCQIFENYHKWFVFWDTTSSHHCGSCHGVAPTLEPKLVMKWYQQSGNILLILFTSAVCLQLWRMKMLLLPIQLLSHFCQSLLKMRAFIAVCWHRAVLTTKVASYSILSITTFF